MALLDYNSEEMIKHLQDVLESLCGLDVNKPLLIGVSGGPDSLCLMDVFLHAGYRPTIGHLNHGLRPEADTEAQRVKDYTKKLGLEYLSDKIDVHAFMRDEHLSLEEAARIARYRFLFSCAAEIGAQAVAVAHSADDQVETILMNLLRGAGLAGLKGMLYRTLPNAWSQEIPLVRPLLGTWRAEILEYISSQGYEPVYDASNLDVSYLRNRLRHELIPTLEQYNPMLRRNLWQMGEILRDDYHYVQQQVEAAWKVCVLESGDEYIVFSRQLLLDQPKAIERYIFKKGLEALRPGIRDLDSLTIERACKFLFTPTRSRRIELVDGLVLWQDEQRLILSLDRLDVLNSEYPDIQPDISLDLPIPGELRLGEGWVIRATRLQSSPDLLWKIRTNSDPFQAWFDAEKLLPRLMVRSRLPGDRFKPLGMKGHSLKVSDFMVNVKIPQKRRMSYPLLFGRCETNEYELLWIPGYRQNDGCRVTEDTQHVAWMLMERVKTKN